jgi:Fic family protein
MRENGRELTENEYLESKIGNFSKSKNSRNKKVRDALMKNFERRELITMKRPVDDEQKILKLHEIPVEALRQDFVSKLKQLKHKVFHGTPVKMLNDRPISGRLLAKLIMSFVDALNQGALPDLQSAYVLYVCQT